MESKFVFFYIPDPQLPRVQVHVLPQAHILHQIHILHKEQILQESCQERGLSSTSVIVLLTPFPLRTSQLHLILISGSNYLLILKRQFIIVLTWNFSYVHKITFAVLCRISQNPLRTVQILCYTSGLFLDINHNISEYPLESVIL